MKLQIKLLFAVLSLAIAWPTKAEEIVYEEDDDFELVVSSPQVKSKAKEAVKNYMRQKALDFYKQKMEVELARDGEVVIITIPADELFAPNETELKKSASQVLEKFKPYLTARGKFKLLLMMHSDDTGSEDFLFNLTDDRVNAVHDFFEHYNPADDAIYDYPRGDTEPLVDNDTRANRAVNRRLEIYIVPDKALIDELSGK